MISSLSGVDGMKLRKAQLISDEEWALISQAARILAQMPAAFMFSVRFVEDLALEYVKTGDLKDGYEWSRGNILFGHYDYFYYNYHTKNFDSSEAKRLRTRQWILNSNGEFVSANELSLAALNLQYDLSSNEAVELLKILGIKDEIIEQPDVDDITSYGERLGLSEEEQRQALLEYAKRKKAEEDTVDNESEEIEEDDDDSDVEDHVEDEVSPGINRPSIKRVGKEITKRATTKQQERNTGKNESSLPISLARYLINSSFPSLVNSRKLAAYRIPWLTRKFQARMKALSAYSAGTWMSVHSICLGTGSFLSLALRTSTHRGTAPFSLSGIGGGVKVLPLIGNPRSPLKLLQRQ